jgi:hypothetical protein
VGEVGKSTLIGRIKQHADKKDWWSRALLIKSASDEFDSAEIGWLEGRLYDVLNNAVACDLMNGNRPGDSSPSSADAAHPGALRGADHGRAACARRVARHDRVGCRNSIVTLRRRVRTRG